MKTVFFLTFIAVTLYPMMSSAQRFHITGRVTDSITLLPVIHLSVQDRISGTGTITTDQGNYSLLLNSGAVEVVFSGQGFESSVHTFELKSDTIIDVRLNPSLNENRIRRPRKENGIALNFGRGGREVTEEN